MNKVYRLIKNRVTGIVQVAPETARSHTKAKTVIRAGAVAAALACASPAAWAANSWTGATGDWFNTSNWDTSLVPTSADNTKISNGGTAQVQSPGAEALNLNVSGSGISTLNITSGGTVSNVGGFIGESSGSTGAVTVDGIGSTWTNSSNLFVGAYGSGTLDITSGGAVSNAIGDIGGFSTGAGAVTVDGIGSTWINSNLNVGGYGSGTLAITNGGEVNAINSSIGFETGGTGAVTVAGSGSTWTNSNSLTVGNSGNGTLNITSGGVVSNTRSIIGFYGSSTSAVTVAGSGSTWTNSSELIVGGSGSGTLDITSGGTVVSNSGTIGAGLAFFGGDGTGTVTVDGIGSIWSNNSSLDVGIYSSTGTLTITNGGAVNVNGGTGTVTLGRDLGSSGTLNIGDGGVAGILNAATVDGGAGTATLNFNHNDIAYYFTTDGASTGTAITISGSTVVNQNGSGTTILTGTNTYTGGTNINAGTLQIGDGGTTGSITGNVTNNSGLIFNRSDTLGFGGVISGTGSLAKAGAGILTLTGTNTYTGGTTISGGTLQIGNGGTTGSITGNVTNNSGLIFNRSDNLGFGGVISGTGSLTKLGTGTLTLTGTNIYTGGTTISGGTLQIGNDGTTGSITGNVANYGNLIFNRSDDLGFGGAISGTGSLNKLGAGTLTLTSNSNYTGGTTISAGTLQIGDGGTTGSITGNVTNNSGLIFNRSDTLGFGGAISGTGSLTMQGTGILTLTGNSTYTGGTTISASTLRIGNGGTTGSITGDVANNGNLIFNRSDNLGFGGVISGTGSLNKLGAGTLTLTSNSTYTGGTTISAGTLQIGDGGTTGSITGNVTNNSGLIFNRSDNLGFGGVISGTGSLAKAGAGVLTLTGNNTYTGGTTVEAGMLQSGAAGAFVSNTAYTINEGSLLDLNNFGLTMSSLSGTGGFVDLGTAALTVNQASNTSFAGSIVGPGSLTKAGAGVLTLTTTNTYTGGTTISAGTLQIGDGGTTGSITGNVTNNSSLIFNRSDNLGFGGVISGTGSLAKAGAGVLTLTGTNTYTGGTNINAGTLTVNGIIVGDTFVNSGGTLGGSGMLGNVTVNSGGTLSHGNNPGIVTIDGDLTLDSGATIVMQIEGTTLGTEYDHIDVIGGGTATLDGTLDLQFGFVPTIGSSFNLINASDIVLTGNSTNGFNSIIDNLSSNLGASLQVVSVISATEYDILIQQLSFLASPGSTLTPNQTSVAANLDSFSISGQGATLFDALNMLSASELPGAYDSLSGVQHTYTLPQVGHTTRQFMHVLGNRLSLESSETNMAATRLSNVQLAYNGDNITNLFGTPPKSNQWLHAMGGFGAIDSDGNASGANYNSSGVALGYDRELRRGLLAGVAFSFTRSSVDVTAGNTNIDSYQLAAYGRKQWADNYLDATFGIGHHRAGSTRQVQFGGFSEIATAGYDSNNVGLSLETGRHYALSAGSRVTPFVGLEYGHYHQEGYHETGAGDANLTFGSENMDSLRSVLGARLNNALTATNGTHVDTTVGLSWAHEFMDREASLNPAFAVNSGIPFNINGPVIDRDHILATLGVSARLSGTTQLDLNYSGEFAESDRHQTISVTFRMKW